MASSVPGFPRKNTPECLSGWQLSLLASGASDSPELRPARRHVEQCGSCASRLKEESASVAAARVEPLPVSLRAAAARASSQRRASGTGWRWWLGGSIALATPLLALLLMRAPPRAPAVLTKGSMGVEVALLRDGKLVVEGLAAESLSAVKARDQLRLRVTSAVPGAWILLEGKEDGRWERYHAAMLPPDGWLPVGIAITPGGETHLRVTSCPTEQADASECAVRDLKWKTEP